MYAIHTYTVYENSDNEVYIKVLLKSHLQLLAIHMNKNNNHYLRLRTLTHTRLHTHRKHKKMIKEYNFKNGQDVLVENEGKDDGFR